MGGKVRLELKGMIYRSLKFGTSPRRFLTYFAIDMTALVLGFIYTLFNANKIASYFALIESGSVLPGGFLLTLAPLFVIFIAWYVAKTMFNMIVMRQSVKDENCKKIFIKSKLLYPSFLLVTIISGFITGILSMMEPLELAYVLTIIVTLFLFFATVSVAIGKNNVSGALRESIRICIKKWNYVIVAWLTIAVVNSIIVFLFTIPGFLLFFNMILYFLIHGTLEDSMLFLLIQNFPYLILSGIIFLIGTSISAVVNMKLLVEFYKKIKK